MMSVYLALLRSELRVRLRAAVRSVFQLLFPLVFFFMFGELMNARASLGGGNTSYRWCFQSASWETASSAWHASGAGKEVGILRRLRLAR
jgi:hypothetical protein